MSARGGDKRDLCEKAADQSMSVRMQFYSEMAAGLGEAGRLAVTWVAEAMVKEKAAALPRCRSAVKKDAKLGKALDCVINAKNGRALASCQPAGILLSGDTCALALDNTVRITYDLLGRQFAKKRLNVKAMLAQVRPQLLGTREKTLQICYETGKRGSNAEREQAEKVLECDVTVRDATEFGKCQGHKVTMPNELK